MLLPEVLEETGLTGPVPVTAVGSHDTASAVAAVPAERRALRVHLHRHLVAGRAGAGRARAHRGEPGAPTSPTSWAWTARSATCATSWGCGCSRSACAPGSETRTSGDLLRGGGARCRALRSVVDAGDAAFLAPGRMPERIAEACRRVGPAGAPDRRPRPPAASWTPSPWPTAGPSTDAQRLAGPPVDAVHIVGGGARNALLCQLTADACGLPVVAGPAEAAALGNVLVQARAHGLVGDRTAMRRLLARTQPLTRYEPRGDPAAWRAAEARLTDVR